MTCIIGLTSHDNGSWVETLTSDSTPEPHTQTPEQQELAFWAGARETVSRQGVIYHYGETGIDGQFTIEAYLPRSSFAIGVCYYRQISEKTMQVGLIQVYPAFQRLGIATGLCAKMFVVFPHVQQLITARGSLIGGAAFLKATGWVEDDLLGWRVTREMFKGQ